MPDKNSASLPLGRAALIGTLAALLGCTFLWIALITYHPFDWPSTLAWPVNDPPNNGCGRIGAWTAFQLFRYFGVGAYMLAAMLALGAAVRLIRGPLGDWPLRAAGALLLVAATSGAGTLLSAGPAGPRLADAGGVLGIAVVHLLVTQVSTSGTALVLLAALLCGALLAADEIVLRAWRGLKWLGLQGQVALAGAPASTPGSRRSRGDARTSMLQRLRENISSRLAAWTRDEKKSKPASRSAEKNTTRTAAGDEPEESQTTVPDAGLPAAAEKSEGGNRKSAMESTGAESDPARTDSHPAHPDPKSPETPSLALRAGKAVGDPQPAEIGNRKSEIAPVASDDGPAHTVAAPADPARSEPIVRSLGANHTGTKPPVSPWPKELGDYVLPPLELLDDPEYHYVAAQASVVREKAKILETTLTEFRLDAQVVEIDTGPVITMYELKVAPGVKSGQIAALSNDIARALKAPAVRIVHTIAGKDTIGIEVPNVDKEKVRLKELITLSGIKPTKMALPLFLGKDASGNPLIADIAAMPHMLIAGTTGSGKSVCINTLVMSILLTQRPDHVKLILVDPKMVELSVFKEVPHLMCPIVTDMNKAEMILEWAATKMDERYELLAEAGVKHVAHFNRLGKDEIYKRFQPSNDEEKAQIPTHLPYIVIIIDELADLMMTSGKQVEHHLCRIAQKSRAVGIHVILATQRPQANVVTGLIKSNLPCRCAFRVASRMDSRIVLDQNGAEVLMGQGDMLFLPPGTSKLVRAQGTFIEDDELRRILEDLKSKAAPEFHHELVRMKPIGGESAGERDPLFDDAVDIVIETKRGSVSLLQRRLAIGYTRASRLIDQMAFAGIVGDHKGSQQREVLVTADEWAAMKGQRDREVATGNFEADMPDDDSV